MKVQELFDLRGKVAIITGGYRGLGYYMAKGLGEAGADLVICARNLKRCEDTAVELRKLNVSVVPIQCDVTIPDEVNNLIEKTVKEFGKIDILVNNAGCVLEHLAEEITLKDWNKIMNVNATGTFLCAQRVGRVMIKQKGGKIINITSVYGLAGTNLMHCASYHAAKGAVVAFTKEIACEWAQYNINVNAIAPGTFYTPMQEELIKQGILTIDKMLEAYPIKRQGVEDDLKGAIVFLASEASNYITGHILYVDGGYLAW